MTYGGEYEEYKDYSEDINFHESNKLAPEGEQKVALVDIDETICFYPRKRRYDMAVGHMANIQKINDLYDQGWKIIYWTARGGSEKSRKSGKLADQEGLSDLG